MSDPGAAWWARARLALDELAAELLPHPAVSLVDIGLDPAGQCATPVLRVHLRPGEAAPALPAERDGIPVRAVAGDYHPQRGPGPL